MAHYNDFKLKNCVACGHNGSVHPLDIDHWKTRAATPELVHDPRNCLTLCRKCHTQKGQQGVITFAAKNPNVQDWLIGKGWKLDLFSEKWYLS